MTQSFSQKTYRQVIRLNRDNSDYLLPKHFFSVLVRRFFPVMSIIYLTSIFCISVSSGNFKLFLFYDNTAYFRGLLVVLWCAGPAVVWILLGANPLFRNMANLWYKILAGLMQFTICMSYFMFPEMEMYEMRTYLILSFPAFFLIYYLFVVDPLPYEIVYPLNALGVCALIWAMSVEAIMADSFPIMVP
jgi:hypothetical protein